MAYFHQFLNKVKVDKKIKPLPFNKRTTFELTAGENYYISFHSNEAFPCKLIKFDDKNITVDIPTKVKSKKGYIDVDGKISHDWKSTHTLFRDEIGRTPEEAVINEVTL